LEQYKKRHTSVSCEVCHEPLASHVKDNKKVRDMSINKTYTLCAYCHQLQPAKPKNFPQKDFKKHLVEQEQPGLDTADGKEICIVCHDPHNPAAK
jgi:hypothetical protein